MATTMREEAYAPKRVARKAVRAGSRALRYPMVEMWFGAVLRLNLC